MTADAATPRPDRRAAAAHRHRRRAVTGVGVRDDRRRFREQRTIPDARVPVSRRSTTRRLGIFGGLIRQGCEPYAPCNAARLGAGHRRLIRSRSAGRWWASALGWVIVNDDPEEFEIRPAPDQLPGLLFAQVPEPKKTRTGFISISVLSTRKLKWPARSTSAQRMPTSTGRRDLGRSGRSGGQRILRPRSTTTLTRRSR